MLKIEKQTAVGRSDYEPTIRITTEEGSFRIYFGGNFDLYWCYQSEGSVLDGPERKTFTITTEDYGLFSLFETLYENVKTGNVYSVNNDKVFFAESPQKLKQRKKQYAKRNRELQEREQYNPERLFHDDIVDWHSDDFDYEIASAVQIAKGDDAYFVTFKKSNLDAPYCTYSVRMRNSGSRYHPFSLLFLIMYSRLVSYAEEYDQIPPEERGYQKTLGQVK